MKIRFYFNNQIIDNFNEIWTNRLLFEKIENLKLTSPCDIFLVRPNNLNDNPFEIIKSLNKDRKIIIWYMDTVSNQIYDNHKNSINMLCERGYDLKVIIPDHLDKYDLSCEVFNNYSMADCILEQQERDKWLINYLYNDRKKLYRQKYFLSFNGVPKTYRIALLDSIISNNLLEKFDISFNSFFWNDELNLSGLSEYDIEKFDTSILPLHLDLLETTYYTSTKLNLPLYFNSYIDVVSCSNYEQEGVYIDEKTYKSFACMKPFILVGQYGTLKKLRELGFKTFSPWIDESYDDEKDYVKRMNLIIEEIKRISKLSLEEIDKLYFNMDLVFKHNSSQLGIYIHNTDKKILEILE
tara:strand:+ start:329 stop:1387 length:1059 start_codon:yes stop_codon:yes gene_type:complete